MNALVALNSKVWVSKRYLFFGALGSLGFGLAIGLATGFMLGVLALRFVHSWMAFFGG